MIKWLGGGDESKRFSPIVAIFSIVLFLKIVAMIVHNMP